MLLVDTSVWVDHFRHGVALLDDLLASGQVATHPFIIGLVESYPCLDKGS